MRLIPWIRHRGSEQDQHGKADQQRMGLIWTYRWEGICMARELWWAITNERIIRGAI